MTDKQIYDKFIENVIKQNPAFNDNFNWLLQTNFLGCFIWHKTPEGHCFWNRLYQQRFYKNSIFHEWLLKYKNNNKHFINLKFYV